MAEYVKFRLSTAKVGVSMALAALIGGIAGRVGTSQPAVRVTPASAQGSFLKLSGLTGDVKSSFIKLEYKLFKLERDLTFNFLKISDANRRFLKIDAANAEFSKIDAAFSKNEAAIATLGADFLKLSDASADFLKIDATAANSNELGGLTPDAFVQGHGSVLSGAATVPVTTSGTPQPQLLLALPGGSLTVSVDADSNGVHVIFHNATGADLQAVEDSPSGGYDIPTAQTLTAASDTTITLSQGANQLHLQVFPNSALNEALTLILSSEPTPGASPSSFSVVGQLLTGTL
jgi:hypothetical protein